MNNEILEYLQNESNKRLNCNIKLLLDSNQVCVNYKNAYSYGVFCEIVSKIQDRYFSYYKYKYFNGTEMFIDNVVEVYPKEVKQTIYVTEKPKEVIYTKQDCKVFIAGDFPEEVDEYVSDNYYLSGDYSNHWIGYDESEILDKYLIDNGCEYGEHILIDITQ